MKVGLYDIDGKMPNIALMKLSTHHKKNGDIVEKYDSSKHNKYDTIYASSIFTWSDKSRVTSDMITGGTGFNIKSKLPVWVDFLDPDLSIYPDFKQGIGFTTRGCIRKCSFCVVPEKEGNISSYADIVKVAQGRKEVILLDNNILASGYGIDQLKKIAKLGLHIDLNQGLDARLIDDKVAKIVTGIKWLKPIRMACDNIDQLKHLSKAVRHLRWNNCTPSRYFVYVLIKDEASAIDRLREIKMMGLDAFAQPYRDQQNSEIPLNLRQLARWVNQKALFKKYTWEEYKEMQGNKV